MIENRRIRFNNVEGLSVSDLELAAEIWLADICSSRWSTSEVQKIAAILVGWLRDHQLAEAEACAIEDKYRLTREEVQRSFNLLKLFGCLDSFTLDRNGARAAARLTTMQKIRILETREMYRDLMARAAEAGAMEAAADSDWLPLPEPVGEAGAASDDAGAPAHAVMTGKAA